MTNIGLASRAIRVLMAIVLVFGLMPTVVSAADAQTAWATGNRVVCYDDGDLDTYDFLISADACGTTTSEGRAIYTYALNEDGAYKLEEGLSNVEISIASGVKDVRFVGCGVEYNGDITDDPFNDDKANTEGFGWVYSTPNNNVSIDASECPGIKVTLQDLYVSDMTLETNKNFIDFNDSSTSTLRFEGTSIIDYQCPLYGGSPATDACFHVGNAAALNVEGDGTVYGYKWSSGAWIGGNHYEANGEITFDMDASASMYVKGTKQSAIIGAGAATTSNPVTQIPGAITFKSGNYYLITNAKGAAVGGAAGANGGSRGTTVNIDDNALVSINVDYSGAAIGGGGYVYGNDSSGGTLYYTSGTVRPYMDVNAASNVTVGWQGRTVNEGVCDATITAQRLSQDGETMFFMTIPGVSTASSHEVAIDGTTVYSGASTYTCNFIYNARNRGAAGNKDTNVNVYPRSDIGNWYPEADNNFYVFATGTDHEITCDGRSYHAQFVPVEETVDVYQTDDDGNTVYQTDETGNPVRDSSGNLIPIVIGQKTTVTSASYFKLTCSGNSHVWGEDSTCVYCGAENWYDPDATELTITTADELAEFAQIVNGTHETWAQDDFSGKTVKLAADIAVAADGQYAAIDDIVYGSSSYPLHTTQYVVNDDAPRWTPIGAGTAASNTAATGAAFAGTFDGQGHTVSGIYVGNGTATAANTNTVAGLFGIVTGTVKNVTVDGCITAKIVAGGVVAHLDGGTIENCTNKAIVFADGGTTPGGGTENGLSRGGAVGGIVGNAQTGSTITGCSNQGTITCANSAKGGRAGGILGLIDASKEVVTVTKCANSGNVSAYQYAAGIVGLDYSTLAPITECCNTGTITGFSSGSTYVGGIASQCFSSVSDCYNTGDFGIRAWSGSKASHLGGIVSDLKTSGTTVSNCYDTGAVFYYLRDTEQSNMSSYGAIIGSGYGYTVATSAEVNCYSDESLAYEDALYHNQLAADDMKGSQFAAKLSADGTFVADFDGTNDGFPVLAWQVIDPAATVGDVNDNGAINIVDAQIVLDMANGVWTSTGAARAHDELLAALANGWNTATVTYAADFNRDGIVDATDARAIQNHVA